MKEHPACAAALAKYRINPGNVGFKDKRDRQFAEIIEIALQHGKPVRIGVNWGSLDQDLLTRLMDENAALPEPKDAREVMHEAIVQSALLSAERAIELGLGPERIVLSAKVSAVQDLIAVYAMLAARSELALHLGLTEAGMGSKGIVASSAALGVLLQQGIGDTIRISLTPEPNGDRTLEVKVAQELLQSMGFRAFVPLVAACPGCGRTTSTTFQELARDIQDFIRDSMPEWKRRYPGVETLTVAVMGCIVNGPGEVEARRYRHLAARHRRGAGRARVHRRQEGLDLARARRRGRVQAIGARLYRAAVRSGRPRARRGGVRNAHSLACGFGAGGRLLCGAGARRGRHRGGADSWIGCWARVYDAVHLAKHPGQKVAAITLSIAAREGASGDAPGDYRAKLTALMRDKPDTYSNPGGSRCVASGETLSCFTDGFFLGKFSLEHAGKNMKLAISGADEHVALVPGIDLSSFVVLSPENPEHTLFLLNPAPAKTCTK